MSKYKEFIREVVADVICCEPDEISDTADFVRELDVSSVQMLEIAAAVEDEYDIEIKASELSKYNTVEKIAEMLEKIG